MNITRSLLKENDIILEKSFYKYSIARFSKCFLKNFNLNCIVSCKARIIINSLGTFVSPRVRQVLVFGRQTRVPTALPRVLI